MRYYPSPFPLPPSDRVETFHHDVAFVTREAADAMMPLREGSAS